MRALEIRGGFGLDNLALVERPDPAPGPGQVVVRMRAASLNYRDLLMVQGKYNPKQKLPLVPCSDGAGEVVEVGEGVTRVKPGDRVCGIFAQRWIAGEPNREKLRSTLGGPLDGMLAELVVLPEEGVVPVPPHLSWEEAATLPCAGVTAWNAVAEGKPLREGETVVVLGTGGVALFALQFAKLLGARAIITSSSDAKLARARELGADDGVNYRTTADWPRAVRELTGGEGAHLVVDTAGELAAAIEAVRVGGKIAFVGLLRGTRADVDLVKLMGSSATIRAIDVGSRAMFESMNRAIESAEMRPVVDRTFAFDEARDAFRYLREGRALWKGVHPRVALALRLHGARPSRMVMDSASICIFPSRMRMTAHGPSVSSSRVTPAASRLTMRMKRCAVSAALSSSSPSPLVISSVPGAVNSTRRRSVTASPAARALSCSPAPPLTRSATCSPDTGRISTRSG